MTAPYRGEYERPFNTWVRNHPKLGSGPNEAALSIQNLDFIIHKYLVREDKTGYVLNHIHLMLIELKTMGAAMRDPQRDTLWVLDQLLSAADKRVVNTLSRGPKTTFYHGLHLLRLSGTTPDDSAQMCWDKKTDPITADTLVGLLRFEIEAHTLKPREERNHHRPQPWLIEPTIGDPCSPPPQSQL